VYVQDEGTIVVGGPSVVVSGEKKLSEPEPSVHMVSNPSRCMRQQLRYMSMPPDARYTPVKSLTHGGVVMFIDQRPNDSESLVTASAGMCAAGVLQV
jgi:hypothetical protein